MPPASKWLAIFALSALGRLLMPTCTSEVSRKRRSSLPWAGSPTASDRAAGHVVPAEHGGGGGLQRALAAKRLDRVAGFLAAGAVETDAGARVAQVSPAWLLASSGQVPAPGAGAEKGALRKMLGQVVGFAGVRGPVKQSASSAAVRRDVQASSGCLVLRGLSSCAWRDLTSSPT